MSRTAAEEQFRWNHVKPLLEPSAACTCSPPASTRTRWSYKDIHEVMAQQSDLVDVVARFDPKIVRMADAGEKPED